jgi:NAD(P)-dependent dehydrogenase (short-subunit alcohol dehydrogenase family)
MLNRLSVAEARPKTVLITGASRGIGEASAQYFLEKGWCVAAGMRSPGASRLGPSNRLRLYELDVMSPSSVRGAVNGAIADFGRIDVLINNAGLCLVGAHEELSEDDDRAVVETNVLGPMRVVRALLPHMRQMGGGRIVNVSSMCGAMTLPLYSAYCASKWGLEGFSESLAFEVRRHGIKVKIVQPGVHRTGSFDSQVARREKQAAHPAYAALAQAVLPRLAAFERNAPAPDAVAKIIFKAATDRWPRLRYPIHTGAALLARRFVPTSLYVRAVRRITSAW